MPKTIRRALLGSAVILCLILTVKGSELLIPSGTWQATGTLSAPRAGAAASLTNGRILVTGGDPGTGPVTNADSIGLDGIVSPAPPMLTARSKHVSVVLQDGRVLVAGGVTTGGGTTNAAEIFDPLANSWTTVAYGMNEARAGATAALLQDGRVLIAGGQNGAVVSSTIEIFDPVTGVFTFGGTMSSPRSQHAMAVLNDGRVLIVGGFNGSGPVASTDIFDPAAGTLSAGPALAVARFGHSATTLLNGQVVVIGGNNGNANQSQMDVASAELFDPTAGTFTALAASLVTPREGHLALLLSNNNNILIAGGTSAGAVLPAAELFTAQPVSDGTWSYAFAATNAMTLARSSAAASANQVNAPTSVTQHNGVVLVAGGSDASGKALGSAEGYGYATVQTDQSDYPPGTPVTITGSGWKPGETVTIQLVESPLIDTHGPYTIQADANGNISDSSFTTDTHDLDVRFYLTVTGGTSGFVAQNTFTDSKNLTIAFSGAGSGSVSGTGGYNCTDTAGVASGTCAEGFNNGDQISLTATSGSGSAVTTWATTGVTVNSGCTSGSTTCVVTMSTTAATVTVTMVVAGSANKLAFLQQPTSTAAGASILPAVTVQVEDSSGNLVNKSGASITLAISTNPGGGTLSGTATVSAINGVATFNNLSINKTGTGYTLAATSTGLTGQTSSAFNITPGALDHFKVEQSGGGAIGTQTAGTAFNIRVTAQDVNNNTVTSFTGTAVLTSSGTLTGSPLTSGSFTAGVLDPQSVTITNTGSFTVTATGSTKTGTSASFTVNSGPLDHFAVEKSGGGAVGTQTAGTSFNIRVTAQDVNNNIVTSFTSTAVLISSGTLTGSPVTSGSFTAGVLDPQSVTITNTGSFTITATGSTKTGTSASFTVNSGPLDHFAVEKSGGGAIGTQTAGTAFNIRVTAQDVNNNTVTSFTSTVVLTSSGTLTGSPLTSGSFTAGVLDPQSVTITNTGSFTITATGSTKTGTSAAFTVNPGVLDHFKVEQSGGGAIGTQTAGTAFNIRVTAQDVDNNTVTSFTSTVALTSSGTLTGSPLTSGSFTAGVLDPQGVTITSTGSVTITATGSSKTGTSAAFTVNSGPLDHFAVEKSGGGAIGTQTAGAAFNIRVTAQDVNNNTVTSFASAVVLTSSGTLTGSPLTSGSFTAGVLDPQGVTITSTGSVTITATGSSKTGTSNAFTVNPGALDHFKVEQSGGGAIGTQTAGTAFNLRVTAQDVNNNTVTSFTSTVALTSSGTLTGSPLTSGSFTAGVLDPQSVTITNTGSFTVTATGSGKTGTSNAFTVNPGALDHFKVEQSGGGAIGTQTAGTAFNIRVTAQDVDNNTVTSFTSTAVLTSSGTLTGSPLTSGSFTAGVLDPQSVTITNTGSFTVTATGSSKTGTSASFTVNSGPLDHFAVEKSGGGAIGTQTAGTAFNIRVTAQDVNNNIVTSFTSTAVLTSSGTLTGSPLTSGSFTAGVLDPQSVTITNTGSFTITATGSTKTGTSNAFTVNPGALDHFKVEQSGGGAVGTQTAGTAFNIRATAQDVDNNTVTSFTSTVVLTSSGTLTGSPLTSGSFTAGVLDPQSVTITNTGSFTVTATGSGKTGTSNALTVNPGALDHFKVEKSGGGAIGTQTAGTAFNIRVTAQDVDNNTVTSFTSTVVLTSSGTLTGTPLTSGSFTAGVLDPQGVTITSTGSVTITATGSGKTGTSAAFTVNPGALDHLAIGAISSPQTAGTAFNVTITAEDANNNTVTSFDGDGNKAVLTSTGTLTGAPITTNSFTQGVLVGGQNVTITNTGTFTITATSSGPSNGKIGISNSFTVNPAPASKLVFAQQPTNTVAGQAISPSVTIQVQDQFGNVVTTDGSSVSVAISAGGVLSGTSTTAVAASGGIATFSNLVPTKTGTFTLSATDGSLTGTTSSSFNVTAAAANKLAFTTEPSASATAGNAFAQQPAVTIEDQFGNPVPTSSAPVTLAITAATGTAGATLNCASNPLSAASGVATFSACGITLAGNNYTLTATSPSLASAVSTAITVSGRTTATAISSAASTNVGGTAVFTVTVTDTTGGNVSTPSGTVSLSSTSIPANSDGFSPCTLAQGANPVGTASCPVTVTATTPTGTHTINATFTPADNIHTGSSTTTAGTLTVNARVTSTSISPLTTTAAIGQGAGFTVTVTDTDTGAPSTPSGTVTVLSSNGSDSIGACTLAQTVVGTATCTTTVTPAAPTGTHTISASFASGDGVHASSSTTTNASLTVTNPATMTTVMSSNNPSTYGGAVTFTAMVTSAAGTPTGSITFYDGTCSGTALAGPTSLSLGGQASFNTSTLSAPSHTITACYTPTGIYLPSSRSVLQTVNKATATIVVAGYNVTYDGNPHTATGTATGVFSEALAGLDLSGTTHSGAGTYSDSWAFTDVTGNYNNAAGLVSDVIHQASSSVAVISSANPSTFGSPVTFTATVSSTGGTPTGTAQFVIDGANFGAPVSLVSGGATSGAAASLAAGEHIVTAVYGGDSNFGGSTSPFLNQVIKNPLASIAVTPASPTISVSGTEPFVATGTFKDGSKAILPTGGTWAIGNSMSQAVRAPMAAEGSNGLLYFFGGQDASGAENYVQSYNPATGAWGSGANAGFTARYQGVAVAPGNGLIYVIGGWQGAVGSVVEAYNPSLDNWATEASVPHRSACSIGGAINGLIYVLTGCDGNAGFSKEFDVYNPATNTWSSLTSPMHAHDSGAGGVIGGKFYVAGGYDVSPATNIVEVYDPQTSAWTTLSSTLPAQLAELSGAVSNGLLYVVGGLDNSSVAQPSAYSYDPAHDVWTSLSMLSEGRRDIGLTAVDGLLYATGGMTASLSQTDLLEILDTDKVTWASDTPGVATIDMNSGLATSVTAGTANVSATSAASSVSGSTLLTVIKKDQTITFGALANKTYGAADFAVSATASSGLAVTFMASGNCTVTPDGLTAHITGAGSCTITAQQPGDATTWQAAPDVPQTFSIGQAHLTVTADDKSKTYDGVVFSPFTATITGFVNSETVAVVSGSAAYSANATSAVNAGSYTITPSVGTLSATNYDFTTFNTGTLTINKATAVVVVTPYTVTYNGQPHTATVSTITGVNGESGATVGTVDVSNTTHTNAGTYASDTWSFTGTANYNNIAATTITDAINKADATFTVSPYTVTYDGNAHTATVSTITGVNGESGATVGVVTLTTTHTNAGTYASDTWSFTGTANYNNIAATTITDAINKADATFTVSPYTVTYDGNAHTATVSTITGVNGESGATVGVVTLTTTHTNAGTYASDTWSFTGTANYNNIAATTITDAINKADATFTVSPYTVTYDGNAHTATVSTITGVNGESGATVGTVNVSNATHTNAGTYASDTWSFTGTANYNNIAATTITDTINQAISTTVVSVAGGTTFTYDGNAHLATVSVTGAAGLSLTPAPVYSCGHPPIDVSDSGCTASYTYAGDPNHTGSADSKTYIITQASATITVNGYAGVYDANPHGASGTATGVKGEDLNSLLHLGASLTTVPGGTANWSFDGNTDYQPANGSVSITITQATPTVRATGNSCTYNANPCIGSGSATGVKGEALAPAVTLSYVGTGSTTYGPAGSAPTSAGTYTVTASFAGGTNYTSGLSAPAVLAISQAATTTSIVTSGSPTIYGQLVTFTVTVSSPGAPAPSGSVNILDGASVIATVTLAGGTATYSTFSLPPGSNSITAVYPATPNYLGSASTALLQTVTAAPIVSLDPGSITFPAQDVGGDDDDRDDANTASAAMPVVLTNIGSTSLNLSNIQITGSDPGDFIIASNSCLSSLAPSTSCTVRVQFNPQDTSIRTATLAFTDNDGGSLNPVSQFIGLTGSAVTAVSANFTKPAIAANNYIWFGSEFSVKGPNGEDGNELDMSHSKIQVFVTNGTITFTNPTTSAPVTLPVPDALITFDPAATQATTTYDATNYIWRTTIPAVDPVSKKQHFDIPGEIFATGLAYQVPSGGLPGGVKDVTWSASYSTDTPGVKVKWEWGAAVYSSFSTNYALLGVKPVDDGKAPSLYANKDGAGTPESDKQYLTMGALANDQNDYVGDFTPDAGVIPSVTPVSISPAPVVFAVPLAAGTSSSPMPVTVTNNNESLTLNASTVKISGDYAIVSTTGVCNTSGFTLPPGSSCTFNITFTPTDLGTRTGALTFTYAAPAGMDADDAPPPQKVDLFGTGAGGSNPIVGLSQVSLNFGNQEKSEPSTPQTVMLVNAGGASLAITGIQASGDYTQTNTCGSAVAADANCTITVTFTPTILGTRTGTIKITDNNGGLTGSTQTINLTGKGTP